MPLSFERIQGLAQTIAERFHPRKIILFGSYAWGTPTEDSDVDLLVVLPFEEHPVRIASAIRYVLSRDISLDVLARTPGDIASQLKQEDGFISRIIKQGQVLWETPDVF
jgi:predicted nucleotidyltransferase